MLRDICIVLLLMLAVLAADSTGLIDLVAASSAEGRISTGVADCDTDVPMLGDPLEWRMDLPLDAWTHCPDQTATAWITRYRELTDEMGKDPPEAHRRVLREQLTRLAGYMLIMPLSRWSEADLTLRGLNGCGYAEAELVVWAIDLYLTEVRHDKPCDEWHKVFGPLLCQLPARELFQNECPKHSTLPSTDGG